VTDQPLEPDEPPVAPSEPGPSAPQTGEQRLYRSRDDRVIGGVCGGIGQHLGVDPVFVRIAAVILAFAGGAGIVLYLVGLIAIPEEPPEGVTRPASTTGPSETTSGAVVLGIVFVVLGAIFLIDELWPDVLSWRYVWPIGLIAVGLAILLRGRR